MCYLILIMIQSSGDVPDEGQLLWPKAKTQERAPYQNHANKVVILLYIHIVSDE